MRSPASEIATDTKTSMDANKSLPARDSGFETDNGKVHRFSRAHGVEILAEEHDLTTCGTQKHYVILTIDTPGGFDDCLRLDLGDGPLLIGDGIYRKLEEAKIVHGSSEPCDVTNDLLSPG